MSHRSDRQEPLVVHPEAASDPSSMQRIVGYVHTLIPQSYSNQAEELKQKILWAKFEQLDCQLKSCFGPHSDEDLKSTSSPLVLVLGYPSGYSVWSISGEGGEGREVLAHHTGGPVRVATFLKTPEEGLTDVYAEQRPLLVVVSRPFDKLVPVSLRDGKDLMKHTISFKRKSEQGMIVDVVSSSRYVVVVLQSRITLLDAGNLSSYLFYIKNNHTPLEYPWNPVALGPRWLAYSDSKLHTQHHSQGGVYSVDGGSYTAKVLDAVEGVRRYASDMYSKYWTGEQQQQRWGGDSQGGSGPTERPLTPQGVGCIVTVLDVQRVSERMPQGEGGIAKVDLKSMDRGNGVIAHFLACHGQDHRLAAMSFDPSGMLLLTACSEGRTFNLFRILPHPSLSSETCVQHLHVLRRGETTAIVQDIAFSCDSRWAAISTLRGTTHVFPITPYGGPITKRTHLFSRVVNRCGKFHITAGLTDSRRQPSTPAPGAEPQTYATDVEFSLHHLGNPHVVMEKPFEIQPLLQIKQPAMSIVPSQEELQGTSPKLKGKAPLPGPPISTECLPGHIGLVVSAVFAPTRGSWNERSSVRAKQEPQPSLTVDSLYVVGGNAVATEHVLVPRVSRDAKGKDNRDWKNSPDDAPVELDGTPRLSWNLLRSSDTKVNYTAKEAANPLVTEYDRCRASRKEPCRLSSTPLDQWLANVEILTHEEPPRRLWMGPQFSFKTYDSMQSTSAVAVLPGSDQYQRRSEDGGGAVVDSSVTSAVLEMTEEDTSSTLLLDRCHNDLKSIKSKAMMIPQQPGADEGNFVDTGPSSLGPDYIECFGSWKDHMPVVKNGYSPGGITKELEDAMHESPGTNRRRTIPVPTLSRDLSSPEEEFQDTLPGLSQ